MVHSKSFEPGHGDGSIEVFGTGSFRCFDRSPWTRTLSMVRLKTFDQAAVIIRSKSLDQDHVDGSIEYPGPEPCRWFDRSPWIKTLSMVRLKTLDQDHVDGSIEDFEP